MDHNEPHKFFDVARPSQTNPSATSRPVIVGHQPMMIDPMVRGAQNSPSSPTILSRDSAPAPQFATHTAKVIQVSDEIKSQIDEPSNSFNKVPAEPIAQVPVNNTGIGQLPVNDPTLVPKEIQVPANETTVATASHPAAVETLVPGPDLSHMPHVPVSHSSASGSGKLKHLLIWLIVVLVLGSFGAFLAIDAGLINSSIHLPFHIFSQQA